MKKRSKLSLLVSGIIFSIGVVICLIGVGVSASTGEQIYSSKIGDDRGYTYNFSEIDKVKISVADADINIYGGSESSYIEVLNFNENLCSYTGNNSMITFRETSEVEDIAGVWESGLSFKGLRYILRPVPPDKQKTVNIYLAESEHVKAFDIDLHEGNVKIGDIDTVTDYDINLESGKVVIADVETGSSIDVKATGQDAVDIKFSRVTAEMVTVNANRARFVGEEFSSNSCEMKIMLGSANLDFTPFREEFNVSVRTIGKLIVDGNIHLDRYSYPEGDAPATDTDSEDEEDPSGLVIEGNDLAVTLDTPLANAGEKTEDTSQSK